MSGAPHRGNVWAGAKAGADVRYLLRKIWGTGSDTDLRPMRTVVNSLRRKLGDDADRSICISTEPRVGYRLAAPEAPQTGMRPLPPRRGA